MACYIFVRKMIIPVVNISVGWNATEMYVWMVQRVMYVPWKTPLNHNRGVKVKRSYLVSIFNSI